MLTSATLQDVVVRPSRDIMLIVRPALLVLGTNLVPAFARTLFTILTNVPIADMLTPHSIVQIASNHLILLSNFSAMARNAGNRPAKILRF
jgi:hypothetical protein